VSVSQDSHWLDLNRLRLYSRTATVALLILALGLMFHSNIIDPNGFPLVFDFGVFWGAAHLALQGHPADAYQVFHLQAVVQTIIPVVREGSYGWFYPPTFFFFVMPLALLPYLWAYLVFMVLTLLAYVLVVQRIIPGRDAMWCLAGFSGIWLNLLLGQNAFLTGVLAGAVLLLLEKRPVLSGVCLGLLSIKPQLGLLFPVALIAVGAWRTLITAVFVALALMLTAARTFGVDTLTSWWGSLGLAKAFLENGGTTYWMKMPTVFAFLHLLGAPLALSYLGHALVAAGTVGGIWKIWRNCTDSSLRNAALITGTFLVSPYLFEYDLAWLALPIAWMTKIGLEHGWMRWEREILVLAWLLPFLMLIMAKVAAPIQIGPWVSLTFLVVILRRAQAASIQGKIDDSE